MAVSVRSFAGSQSLQIEVEGPTQSGDYGADLAAALRSLAATITAGIETSRREERPGEVHITCGLKAMGNGFVVSADPAQASFSVTMVWRSTGEGAMGDVGPAGTSGLLEE